jgi:hypothetical protein
VPYFWWFEWIISWEDNIKEEDTAAERAVGLQINNKDDNSVVINNCINNYSTCFERQ